MTKSTLKLSMVATAISLSLLAAPAAQAGVSRDTGVGRVIAAQGNAALRVIRMEMKGAALAAMKPVLPAAHSTKVSVPAAGAGAAATASARCAK